MQEKINKQHVQLPNNMADEGLLPKDQLIYLVIKSYNNPEKKCHPSLDKISKLSGYSVPTIRSSIELLEKTGYIKIEKRGRQNYYFFNEYKKFEPFSKEYIKRTDISSSTRANIIAAQQTMYTDIEGYGKISYSNRELAKILNVSEYSIRQTYKELEQKGYLTLEVNNSRDPETGCRTTTKIIHLGELGQAVIWALKKHDDQINKNTEDIQEIKRELEQLKKSNAEKDKLIDKLLKDAKVEQSQYVL